MNPGRPSEAEPPAWPRWPPLLRHVLASSSSGEPLYLKAEPPVLDQVYRMVISESFFGRKIGYCNESWLYLQGKNFGIFYLKLRY